MTKVNEKGLRSTDIRKLAEEALKGKTTDMKKLSSGDGQNLVHELLVHQIELEMQNEDLRRAQKELEDARNRYSDLYDFAPIGYFTFDKNGLILDVNLRGANKLGIDRGNLIKKHFSLYIAPDLKDVFYSHLRQVFHTGTQMNCELRLVDKKGYQFDAKLESIPVHDSDGNLLCRTVMSDITERKRAEKVSQEARRYSESIIDTVRKPFLVMDENLKLLSANRSFYSTFEVTADETVGNLIYDIGNRQWDIPALRTLLEEILPQKTEFNNYEVSHKFKTIGQKTMLLNARQLHQEVIGTSMIFLAIEDITEKRRMEDELSKYREHIEQQIEERTAELKMTNEQLLQDITERKQAEKALLESEEKYRALMDSAGDAIILMDMQGNLLEINTKTESLLGRTNEEVFNEHFSRFIPKNELKRAIAAFDDLIRNGSIVLSDLNLIKKDGTTIPVDMTGTIIQYAGKKVVQVIFRDITERKMVQEALKESEEMYRTMIDFSNDMIWTADMEGRFQFCNRHAEEISGYQLEEWRNKEYFSLIIKEELPKLMEIFSKILKGQPKQYEATVKKQDGTALILSINTAPIYSKGVVIGTVSFGRDITQHKKAEAMQRKLSSAVEHTADIVFIANKDGNIEYVNPAFEKITGYTMKEAVGKTPRILKSGKQDEKFYENLWGTILSGEVFYGELINKKNNGELYYTEKTITPVKDEHGTITHFVSTDKDITDRKKAQEEHLENQRLEAADKAKSEFLANMSHELRTPLNASIGFSQLLNMGMVGELSEKQKHYVEIILTSNQFLLTLINDILDLSKIEAGKIDLVPDKMSVPETIKETLSLLKEKAMNHKVLLKTEFDPELEFIEADKQRFKQVLFNLLSNAIKFSKEEAGAVTIRTKKEGVMAKISVSDTGIGIKEENIGKLFQKFEQLESVISQKYGGTGLGLAITKQLVELHGGRIWAESMYGGGSKFTFLLPIEAK